MTKIIELPPLRDDPEEWDAIEKLLKKHFKETIYYPLLAELQLTKTTLKNTAHANPLMDALFKGVVTYNRGTFSGKFSSGISKELKSLGAQFNRKQGTYKLNWSQLPIEVKNVISASERAFTQKLSKLDDKLKQILPEEVADSFNSSKLFDKVLWKADKKFQQNVKNITVAPQLTDSQRKVIADKWSNNMKLWIRGWTEQEIKKLRQDVQESAFKGNRWGDLIDTIQKSYGVSADKAKFLARQETHLLMATFKETRYKDAGVNEYKWGCVKRPHDKAPPAPHIPGNVRYTHGILEGKIFRWDKDTEVDELGNEKRGGVKKHNGNNPGCDWNCRCFPIPILRPKVK